MPLYTIICRYASPWARIRCPGGRPWPLREIQRRRDPGDHRSRSFVLGADPWPLRRSERRQGPGDHRSSCFVLGADPRPWRPSVAAAGDPAPAGSGRSPEQILRPGCGSGALAAVRGRGGDLSAGGIQEISGAAASSWARIRGRGFSAPDFFGCVCAGFGAPVIPARVLEAGGGGDGVRRRQDIRRITVNGTGAMGAYCLNISATSAAAAASRAAISSFLYL